jgi:hypothetical protein
MTQYLLANGTTPTGFGVRLRSNGTLRATSPCCGRSMTLASGCALCKNCNKDYLPRAEDLGVNIVGDIPVKDPVEQAAAEDWVARLTGYPHGSVHLDVKW